MNGGHDDNRFLRPPGHARRLTARLVVLFVLAVVTIILTIYLVLASAMVYAGPKLPTARLAELSEQSRSPTASRSAGTPCSDPLATGAFPVGCRGHRAGDFAGQPVQDFRAFLRRRADRPDARRKGHQPADHRPGRTAAVERGRRNGAGLGHTRAAGVRDGQRAGDQRLRRRPPAGRRRRGRLGRLPQISHAGGTARRDGP